MLSIDDEVFFHSGKINLIIGPTGAGKTSLLMALLGEMHYIPQGPDSFVNLPRGGGVAYAAQESWVQSDTIKVCSLGAKGLGFVLISHAEQHYLRCTLRRGPVQ